MKCILPRQDVVILNRTKNSLQGSHDKRGVPLYTNRNGKCIEHIELQRVDFHYLLH